MFANTNHPALALLTICLCLPASSAEPGNGVEFTLPGAATPPVEEKTVTVPDVGLPPLQGQETTTNPINAPATCSLDPCTKPTKTDPIERGPTTVSIPGVGSVTFPGFSVPGSPSIPALCGLAPACQPEREVLPKQTVTVPGYPGFIIVEGGPFSTPTVTPVYLTPPATVGAGYGETAASAPRTTERPIIAQQGNIGPIGYSLERPAPAVPHLEPGFLSTSIYLVVAVGENHVALAVPVAA